MGLQKKLPPREFFIEEAIKGGATRGEAEYIYDLYDFYIRFERDELTPEERKKIKKLIFIKWQGKTKSSL